MPPRQARRRTRGARLHRRKRRTPPQTDPPQPRRAHRAGRARLRRGALRRPHARVRRAAVRPAGAARCRHRSLPGSAPPPSAGSRPARTSDDFPLPRGTDNGEQRRVRETGGKLLNQLLAPEEELSVSHLERRASPLNGHSCRSGLGAGSTTRAPADTSRVESCVSIDRSSSCNSMLGARPSWGRSSSRSRAPVDVEALCLAPQAVAGEHELRVEPLAERDARP